MTDNYAQTWMNHQPRRWLRLLIAVLIGAAAYAFVPWQAFTPDGTHVARHAPTISEQRDSIVAQEARRAGVPVQTALAISHVENWTGDSMAVSPRGAVGLMQVMPKYWQHAFEDECGCGSLFRRQRNACIGVRILKQYHEQLKTWDQAIAAYEKGPRRPLPARRYSDSVLDLLAR